MMGSILRSVVTPHTPRLANAEGAPSFLSGVIAGSRSLGEEIQAAKPDAIVLQSAHWVSTFNWYVSCQAVHRGHCVADEAPDMISGIPYERPGDPELAGAIAEQVQALGLTCNRNETEHFTWDYGSLVPLLFIDPDQRIPVVLMSTCIIASLEECAAVGGAVSAAAQATGRSVIFIASSALSHDLVRGPGVWPSGSNQELDRRFMTMLLEGKVTAAKSWLREYSKSVAAEVGGRNLASMLGVLDDRHGAKFRAVQHGEYGPSSGSGNVSISLEPLR